jgi:hypothetical protein
MTWKITDSDLRDYLDAYRISSNFRVNPTILAITGTSPSGHANSCINDIKKNSPEIWNNLQKYTRIDNYGNPNKIHYNDIGPISGDILRFIQTLSRIDNLIGIPDDAIINIVEMGSSYGGLASVILSHNNSVNYYLQDFEEVTDKAVSLLNNLRLAKNVRASHITPPINPYLFISEYCLTEQHFDDIISFINTTQAQHIWLRCNIFNQNEYNIFIDKLKQDIIYC